MKSRRPSQPATRRSFWFQVTARIIATDGDELLESGYVYVKARDKAEASILAAKHVNDTWANADERIECTVDTQTEEINAEAEAFNRAFFNRPESVFTEYSSRIV